MAKIIVPCKVCKKEVERTPGQLKRVNNVYCSRECTVKGRGPVSEETKKKIAKSVSNLWKDEEYRKNVGENVLKKMQEGRKKALEEGRIDPGASNRGKKRPEQARVLKELWKDKEFREKTIEAIKNTDHSKTDEQKRKISEARKREWQDPEYRAHQIKVRKGKPNNFLGKKHSEETKILISEKAKKRFEDPDYAEKVKVAINKARKTDSWKEKQSKARKELWKTDEFKQKALFALSGKKETSLEKKVRECLESLNIEFECQKVIGRCIADFVIAGTKKIIEADGLYWHSKPEVKARDIRRDKWLNEQGYSILRLSEEVINNNPEPAIKEFLSL